MSYTGRQSSRSALLFIALLGFALWLAAIGPLRKSLGLGRAHWVMEVAPSFLAALTFAFWQAFATRSSASASALYAAALIVATEIVQLFLPRYTADLWDIAAGIAGAALSFVFLKRMESQPDPLFRDRSP